MVEHQTKRMSAPVTRRTLLKAGGATAAAAMLARAGGLGALAQDADFDFKYVASGAKLPTDDVQLRWMDSGDQKAVFFKAFFPFYEKQYPNIKVQYDGSNWNQIQQVITLGFRNGSAPDVFQLPGTITMADAVKNNWIGALDDIVPNWSEVRARFPVGTFATGVNEFEGKTYGYPATGNMRINNLLLYNKDYLSEAGYDPTAKIMSWDDFRAAAKKTTEQGKGKYYGLIGGVTQNNALPNVITAFANFAGAIGGALNGVPFNFKTGEFNVAAPEFIGAAELILAIKDDGSTFPGMASLDNPGARGRMPQGLAAMIIQGPWNILAWTEQNPDFHLGVALTPQKDPAHIIPLSNGPGGSNTWSFFSKTKLGQVIGDVFNYMGTLEGQSAWAHFVGAGDPPAFPDVLKNIKLDPLSQTALELAQKYTRLRPDPSVRNPDVQQVQLAFKTLTPSYNDVVVGLFTGQLKDVKQSFTDLQERAEKELDRAIGEAKGKGAKVSREDFVFADWDPTQDYTKLYQK